MRSAAHDSTSHTHRRGVLSEAALALEAEVTAHPGNAEAWRLLGTVHAENDDDLQVSVCMSVCVRQAMEKYGSMAVR
jgi:hypothetical protein